MQHQINAKEVKEKILKFLEQKGPSLPVQVGKTVELNSIFTSAFLSELAAEGLVEITDMKIGGSPLYLLPSKIEMLENFINNLEPKEREACLLLKEKGVLQDDQQSPVVRVALRGIRDFAVPYKVDNKIFWKYFMHREEIKVQEQAAKEETIAQAEIKELKQVEQINRDELVEIKRELEEKKKELEVMKEELSQKDKPHLGLKIEQTKKLIKKPAVKKKIKKIEDKFLTEIKNILANRNIELVKLEQFDKKQVFAIVSMNNEKSLLAAFDKKKIEDSDILKAHKRAFALDLPYIIFSKGEPSKKTKEAIEAHKNLLGMETIELFDNSLKQQSF